MGGLVGRLFREFSVTLAFAIAISTVVSLSVTPMICAYFVRQPPSRDATWLDRRVEGLLSRMIRFYDRTLTFALDHRALMLIVFVATIVLTIGLYIKVPKGYFPAGRYRTDLWRHRSFDRRLLRGHGGLAAQGNRGCDCGSGRRRRWVISRSVAIFGARSTAAVCSSASNRSTSGAISARCRWSARLRAKLNQIPGIRTFMFPAQDLRVGGRQSDAQYQFTLWSADIDELQSGSPRCRSR